MKFQVSNKAILMRMKDIQNACLHNDERLKDCLVPIEKAHVTLLALYVPEDKIWEAKELFESTIHNIVVGHFDDEGGDRFEVTFKGLDSFEDRVVFAEPQKNVHRIKFLNKVFYREFTRWGYSVDSKFKPHFAAFGENDFSSAVNSRYTPHLTILKKGYRNKAK